jgi:threonyl-tRNA synthetase
MNKKKAKAGNNDNEEQLETMRHSASHILAQAVLKEFPDAKLGIGPAIENGFYYDFELSRPLKEEDLEQIEKNMKEIIKKDLPFEKEVVSRKEAKKYLQKNNQEYKIDLLEDIPDKKVSFFVTGKENFRDLCRGPHVKSTGEVGVVKLDRIAGAYWRGDEDEPMLQRIYGYAFENEEDLEEFLEMQEKLKKFDHRLLGKKMDLFSFHEESPGNAFWHPKGLQLINKLIEYWREVHKREGYIEVRTPVLLTKETWEQSGHLQNFKEKMYLSKTADSEDYNYAVKPMNCDGGMIIYNNTQHSYREFPIRMGEIGVVHRYESSGETRGLLRVREFTQDDAHIFCTPEQIKEELKSLIRLFVEFYEDFSLDIDHIELSTRPDKSIGSDEIWDKAESIMRSVLSEENIEHEINPGDGAFYGPKFDFHLGDCMGRTWQCGTIQLDFAQPENFDLEYVNEDGEKVRPIMIHRVVYGSIERFLGIIIEHYGGLFPLWLAPEQIRIIPISDKHSGYANEVCDKLKGDDFRVTVDDRSETMQSRIRDAELAKIPYVLVVGDKEEKNNTVAVRPHGKKDQGMIDVDEYIKIIKEEVQEKKYDQEEK